jgi:hypothetical protein
MVSLPFLEALLLRLWRSLASHSVVSCAWRLHFGSQLVGIPVVFAGGFLCSSFVRDDDPKASSSLFSVVVLFLCRSRFALPCAGIVSW